MCHLCLKKGNAESWLGEWLWWHWEEGLSPRKLWAKTHPSFFELFSRLFCLLPYISQVIEDMNLESLGPWGKSPFKKYSNYKHCVSAVKSWPVHTPWNGILVPATQNELIYVINCMQVSVCSCVCRMEPCCASSVVYGAEFWSRGLEAEVQAWHMGVHCMLARWALVKSVILYVPLNFPAL